MSSRYNRRRPPPPPPPPVQAVKCPALNRYLLAGPDTVCPVLKGYPCCWQPKGVKVTPPVVEYLTPGTLTGIDMPPAPTSRSHFND